MKKMNTSPISGTLELLPAEQAVFDKFKRETEEVFHQHGFLRIETPTIDRTEVLFAKAGGETEKQIYRVVKTEETEKDADQALRFDHTVPLARYVVEHENDLAFPFKVSQVGRNFRGERAQKGRFREFYQADVDVIGRNRLALDYDAEIILTLFSAVEKILPETHKIVRVSNRKILSGFLEELDLQGCAAEIFRIVDRAEKVTAEKTRGCLEELEIGSEQVARILEFIEISGDAEAVGVKLREFGFANAKFNEGVEELEKVLWRLEKALPAGAAKGDMKIVRGLDYYTGTVFETFLPEFREIGSVCSGGRYENLAELYSDQVFPGVGGSIGLTRLYFVLNELGLVAQGAENPVEVAIIPVSEGEMEFCFDLAERLRGEGKTVDLVLSEKDLKDKMKYAAKVARYGIVIGENEVKSGEYRMKDFRMGEYI